MTRINVGVSPSELPNKLLLAEHREITRIPNAVRTGKVDFQGIPQKFTLGTGHVKFFYNKLQYLAKRYQDLFHECQKRNFLITDKSSAFTQHDLPQWCWNDYSHEPHDRLLIVERINSKGFELLEND